MNAKNKPIRIHHQEKLIMDTKRIHDRCIIHPRGDQMLKNKRNVLTIGLLVVTMLVAGCTGTKTLSQDDMMTDTHYGGAILKEPAREASEDIYSVSPIEKVEGYKNFDRQVVVYGLTLMIQKDIEDDFVHRITDAMVAMFPKLEGEAAKKQEQVLQSMYRYKAMLPVVKNEADMEEDQIALMSAYSLCDIIMKTDNHQVNEVMEHLLHAITDVGLSYVYPDQWGFTDTAKVKGLMDQAVADKNYDIKGYGDYPDTIKHRILVQEYAYWAISSYWNLQETYGVGDSEWTLNNRQSLSQSQPDMVKMIEETVNPIMVVPSEDVLNKLGSK